MKIIEKCKLAIIFALLGVSLHSQEGETMAPKEKLIEVNMEGTVTAISKENREITLKGPDGELMTVTAGDNVKRFDEIAVGDVIALDYYTYIMAEFREPTSEELAQPIVVLADEYKAPADVPPGAAVGALVRAVVTVEIINRPHQLVTVKGPQGNYVSISVEDESLMEKLHVGQVVIITYAEAMAVGLAKVGQ
jgi:hypothetical protein